MPGKKVKPPLAKEAQRLSSFFPAVQTPLVPVAYGTDTSDEEAGTESEDDDYDEMGIALDKDSAPASCSTLDRSPCCKRR